MLIINHTAPDFRKICVNKWEIEVKQPIKSSWLTMTDWLANQIAECDGEYLKMSEDGTKEQIPFLTSRWSNIELLIWNESFFEKIF